MITKALQTLRPNAQWVLRGSEYSGLEWLDTVQTQPTEAEINAEIIRLEADYAAKQYQRDRAKAYPSIVDQLDTLYHSGIDAWKQEIKAVKDQYPKGAM
jgi:hypothetical protein